MVESRSVTSYVPDVELLAACGKTFAAVSFVSLAKYIASNVIPLGRPGQDTVHTHSLGLRPLCRHFSCIFSGGKVHVQAAPAGHLVQRCEPGGGGGRSASDITPVLLSGLLT